MAFRRPDSVFIRFLRQTSVNKKRRLYTQKQSTHRGLSVTSCPCIFFNKFRDTFTELSALIFSNPTVYKSICGFVSCQNQLGHQLRTTALYFPVFIKRSDTFRFFLFPRNQLLLITAVQCCRHTCSVVSCGFRVLYKPKVLTNILVFFSINSILQQFIHSTYSLAGM